LRDVFVGHDILLLTRTSRNQKDNFNRRGRKERKEKLKIFAPSAFFAVNFLLMEQRFDYFCYLKNKKAGLPDRPECMAQVLAIPPPGGAVGTGLSGH
jgi:hypothetical protein